MLIFKLTKGRAALAWKESGGVTAVYEREIKKGAHLHWAIFRAREVEIGKAAAKRPLSFSLHFS